jgi:hypothetical protein
MKGEAGHNKYIMAREELIRYMEQQPYDGLFGTPPEWLPQPLRKEFNRARDGILGCIEDKCSLKKFWNHMLDTFEENYRPVDSLNFEGWFPKISNLKKQFLTNHIYYSQCSFYAFQLSRVMDIVNLGPVEGMNQYLGQQSRQADEKHRIHDKQVSNAKKKSGKGKLYKSLNRLCQEFGTTDFDELIRQIAINTDEYMGDKVNTRVDDLFGSNTDPIHIMNIELENDVVSFYMRDKGAKKRPVKRIKAILREIKKQQCN